MTTKFRAVREKMAPERQERIRRRTQDLSSLRRFVEAMGGELEITAKFPDGKVRIQLFQDLQEKGEPAKV
jgi:Holliday junction resolvase